MLWVAAWKISSGCFLKKTSLRVNGRTPQRFRRRRRKPFGVKVARVGARYIVRPVADLGEVLNYAVPADGLLWFRGVRTGAAASPRRVQVRLLRDRRVIEQEIAVAGCDPSASGR